MIPLFRAVAVGSRTLSRLMSAPAPAVPLGSQDYGPPHVKEDAQLKVIACPAKRVGRVIIELCTSNKINILLIFHRLTLLLSEIFETTYIMRTF